MYIDKHKRGFWKLENENPMTTSKDLFIKTYPDKLEAEAGGFLGLLHQPEWTNKQKQPTKRNNNNNNNITTTKNNQPTDQISYWVST